MKNFDEKVEFRIDTLRAALKHPQGIDLIMEQKSEQDEGLRKCLQEHADRVDELSDIELFVLTMRLHHDD